MHPSLFSFFNRGVASIFALSFGIAAAPNGFCSDVFRGNETFQSFNKAKKNIRASGDIRSSRYALLQRPI